MGLVRNNSSGVARGHDTRESDATARAWKAKGDGVKAKELARRAAEANILPLITYAFVRADAKTAS